MKTVSCRPKPLRFYRGVVATEATYVSSSNIASAIGRTMKLIRQHIPRSEPLLPDLVLRELLVNAYLHRCYRAQASIHIDIRPSEIEIQNPGGLLGSLTVDALLYAPRFIGMGCSPRLRDSSHAWRGVITLPSCFSGWQAANLRGSAGLRGRC